MSFSSLLLPLSFLYWDTAVSYTALAILLGGAFGSGGFIPFLPWLACVLASFLILRLFLNRDRSFNLTVLVILVLAAAQISFLLLTYPSDYRFRPLMFAVTALVCPIARVCQYCFEPPLLSRLQIRFEVSVLVFALALLADSTKRMSAHWLLPLLSATLLCLFSMILSRVLGQDILTTHPWGAALAVAASFALLAAVTGAAWVLLILPYEAGVSAVLNFFLELGKKLVSLINRFFLFLASLMPETQQELEAVPLFGPQFNTQEMELMDFSLPWLPAALGGSAFLLLLLLLWKLRHLRLRAPTITRRRSSTGRTRTSLWQALRRAFARLSHRIRLRIALFCQRGTCQGVYYWLTDKNARHPAYAQISGETPDEYLSRLAGSCPAAAPLLAELSSRLCAQWYGGQPSGPFKGRPLRKAWRKHLRPPLSSRLNRIKAFLFKT